MKLVDIAKKYIKHLKNPYWRANCRYIKYYDSLAIDEKTILVESQSAIKADGNIYYILKYLTSASEYRGYKIYIAAKGKYRSSVEARLDAGKITGVTIVLCDGDMYVRLLASAKYLITDATFPFYFIKKKGQIYLNTWHGTPLKAMGRNVKTDGMLGNVQKNFVCADYILCANEFSRNIWLRDFMLENIAPGFTVLCGYPRNTIFFDEEARDTLRKKLNPSGKCIYAYMPTWRGTMRRIGEDSDSDRLISYLCELDKKLCDDEEMYINLHPLFATSKHAIDINGFEHIKPFPKEYETYELLNIADVLVTDYSSVFFDYANTRRKIVLFPYDKEEYLKGRGMYIDMDDLPFPKVYDIDSLMRELRSGKSYDDAQFMAQFCPYDNKNAAQQLCDLVILGRDTGLTVEKIPDNGRENVLLYAGAMDKNGITAALRALTDCIDLSKRNYYISFCQKKAKDVEAQLRTFNQELNYFAIAESLNLTIRDRVVVKLYNKGLMTAGIYMKLMGKRFDQEMTRAYGPVRFDTAIQFCGYEDEWILNYSRFKGNTAIFVHNDMISEIKTRHNQRTSVLRYAYRNYDHVVTVSEDIVPPTVQLGGGDDRIITVHNAIDYKTIVKRSKEPIVLDETMRCTLSEDALKQTLASDKKKFINVGRFSPEKGHDRLVDAFYRLWKEKPDIYLIIMGGNNKSEGYEALEGKIKKMGLEHNVILLLSVSNPYPIIKACDYFIMSSFYEGLPMVLFEADVLGLPIASTDVSGPHGFLTRFGGNLVENSEDGVYRALNMLLSDEVKALNIDYDAYNEECVREFEQIFS